MKELEEGTLLQLDFGKLDKLAEKGMGVIPVAVQHADTKEMLLIAYINNFALREAIRTRTLVLWSSSRNKLHIKSATSGQTYALVEVFVNCEQNSLLFTVRQSPGIVGGICHTNNSQGQPRNCFYRKLNLDTLQLDNLDP